MNEAQILVTSIGEHAAQALKNSGMESLRVTLDPRLGAADVHVVLKDLSFGARMRAIEHFQSVHQLFEDETSLLLRFSSQSEFDQEGSRLSTSAAPSYCVH